MGPTAHLTPRALTRLVRPLVLRQLTRPCAFGSRHPISYPVLSLTPDPRYLPGSELLAPDTRLVTLSFQLVTSAPCTYPAEAPTTLFSPVKLLPCAYPASSSGLQDLQLTTSQTNA
jgi:hypothetical protein